MVSKVRTVAFQGVEAHSIEVEAFSASGLPNIVIVGLPDKAVAESKERIRACFEYISLGLPPRRIVVNLAPADIQKEGSHYDLPIALAILGSLNVIDPNELENFVALGELGLDGRLCRVNGVLPAAMNAMENKRTLICPKESEKEALWAGNISLISPKNLHELIRHIKGEIVLHSATDPVSCFNLESSLNMADVKGQLIARRALEIAAAGGHHSLMIGPPGVGKSMLAQRLPSILPDLTSKEALEVTIIHSLAGILPENGLVSTRPFRDPHHSSSAVSIVGGGSKPKPGEISLAHQGVLFLDEFPEFQKAALEALRQPLETKSITVARANHHITYPASIQLIAAMNPCRCGYFLDPLRRCSKAPLCAENYKNKISGPLWDRFDLVITVDDVKPTDLIKAPLGEDSSLVKERVQKARNFQLNRYQKLNSMIDGKILHEATPLCDEAKKLLEKAIDRFKLSARGYHRILRVVRTIADMEESEKISKEHMAEALSYKIYNTGISC
jgi:magnesium chelatase family protein